MKLNDELRLRLPGSVKDAVTKAASAQGLCMSAYVRQSVIARLSCESSPPAKEYLRFDGEAA